MFKMNRNKLLEETYNAFCYKLFMTNACWLRFYDSKDSVRGFEEESFVAKVFQDRRESFEVEEEEEIERNISQN
jgi:hypothetical protein